MCEATGEKERKVLERLKNAVVSFSEEEMQGAIEEAFVIGMDANKAIFEGLVPGIEEVGRLYDKESYFIPEMLMCTEVLYQGLEILKKRVAKKNLGFRGVVLIGVVEGDIHDVGKNIVKTMLEASGFEVYDLGRDVPVEKFLDEHKKIKPDLVCLSAMMTTTMTEIKRIIRKLRERNSNVNILVGGAPVNEYLARSWGATGYAVNAHLALKVAVETVISVKKLQAEQLI